MTDSSTNRRTALKIIGSGVAAAPLMAQAAAQAQFDCGVASGDPTQDSVIIWTRLGADDTSPPQRVSWQVAHDKNMQRIVASGSVSTDAARDFTVKVDVQGLDAGRRYYYRFTHGETRSPSGARKPCPTMGG